MIARRLRYSWLREPPLAADFNVRSHRGTYEALAEREPWLPDLLALLWLRPLHATTSQTGPAFGRVTRCVAKADIRTAGYELLCRRHVTTSDGFVQWGIFLVIWC
jgi:hypothetical protein